MGDNKSVRDADNASFVGAADELSDTSFSPKVTLLAGDSTPTPYRIDLALGATNETAPATDIASSGLNGRLQRIAQRITSLIALVPAALTGAGNFKAALLEALPAGANIIGGITKSTAIDDVADVTLNNGSETSLSATDSTRREAIIVADPANTVNIRIGKTGQVGAARGALLQPGQSITLATTAAIYGFAAAASQKVSLVLLKD